MGPVVTTSIPQD